MQNSNLPPQYAQKIAAIVLQIQPSAKVDILNVDFISVNGKQLDLISVFRSMQSKEQDPVVFLQKYLKHLLEIDLQDFSNFDSVRKHIIPRIYPESFVNKSEEECPSSPFVNDTKICYAIDLPEVIVGITSYRMKTWGITLDELDEVARSNLIESTPDFHPQISPAEDGGWTAMLTSGDYYESSRLLLPNLYDDLSQFLQGDFYAIIPARNYLMFFSKTPVNMVERLKKNAGRLYESLPYPITPRLFLVTLDGIAGVSP